MEKITSFKGLELIVTSDDVENVNSLLEKDKELLCDVCDSRSFIIKVLIEASLDVSASKRFSQVILRDHEVNTISAIKVIKCATCGSKDFIKEKIKRGTNEESISTRKSAN